MHFSHMPRRSAAFAIFVGGGIAGAFDITYAIVFSWFRGVGPMRILQSVATGLLGTKSYEGGFATAVLGLALHFVIALLWATIFYAASGRLSLLTQRPVASGVIFGALVYVVMNTVVLPLSAFPHPIRFVPIVTFSGLLVHMFLIGVPIALATRAARK
jgi:hypothetical protein